MSRKTAFTKTSYKFNIENERKVSLKKRPSSIEGSDESLKNIFPGQSTPPAAAVLTQFVLEGRNGNKLYSKDFNKSWLIDDHQIPLEALYKRYGTHPERGLNNEQIKKNLDSYGRNILFQTKKTSEFKNFMKNLLMGLNLLLWICGLLSIFVYASQFIYKQDTDIQNDNLYAGIALFIVVCIAGCFSYYQQFKSQRILQSFKSMIPQSTIVWRNSQRIDINVHELVVGDVVEIKYGECVPADIRLIECFGFKVDNSTLTGEAELVKKSSICTDSNPLETQNLIFFSTNVIEGSAMGIVVRVGNSTYMGRLASLATEIDSTETPLSKEMWSINLIITIISLTFGCIFFIIGLTMGYTFSSTIFFVIGIIVGNVPDNLNVSLTIVLALTAKKLAKKNCLVKHLHAVETLGSTSVICTDKTGTITQNKMSVAHLWYNNTIIEADTSGEAIKNDDGKNVLHKIRNVKNDDQYECLTINNNSRPGFSELANVAILCSRARFKCNQSADVSILKRKVEGDSSEAAILKYMEIEVGDVLSTRDKYPKVCEIPFTSKIKFQVSIHEMKNYDDDPRYLLVMKGAVERLVDFCSTILIGNEEYDMNDDWKTEIDKVYRFLGSRGERVLGFCDYRLPIQEYPINYKFDSDNPTFLQHQNMRFVGMMSMIDPPRAAVPEAIRKCREAGIKVIMITGDHFITAEAIARSVGIISKDSKTIEEIAFERKVDINLLDPLQTKTAVITGSDLSTFTCDNLDSIVSHYDELIFARSSPEQKFMIVEALQRQGHIVAVTGDGVNDSAALKKADIGVSMGLSGTDVAKEVADMILLDDSFETFTFGIENGRLIYDNIKKLIRFTMADNIAEMYCYWVFIILKIPVPMGTIAMLISTSIIDMLSAISLAYEPPESDIMKLKPRDPKQDVLMSRQMLSYAYGQVAVIETFAGFLTYFVVFACNGFLPYSLLNIQDRWYSHAINDLEDSYGQEWTFTARSNLESQAQTGFFISLVLCQMMNVIACKTRRTSLFHKGMIGNNCMFAALIFAPCLTCFFIYTPIIDSATHFIGQRWESWIFGLIFPIFLFVYEELRKYFVRNSNGGFILNEFLV